MRFEFAVISDNISRDCMSRFAEAYVPGYRHSLVFQVFEKALYRAVIPAISAPAHTLPDSVSPQ